MPLCKIVQDLFCKHMVLEYTHLQPGPTHPKRLDAFDPLLSGSAGLALFALCAVAVEPSDCVRTLAS
jgi:hypothetical protein